MKSILLSIKPECVAKILNGEQTIIVRKKFPKDYVGWVYIYCTKDKKYANLVNRGGFLTGMVVARFWCDKVEDIKYHFGYYDMGEWTESYILENACLTSKQLDNYLKASYEYDEKKPSKVYGYAIHISKLEIFDRPRELNEFYKTIGCEHCAGEWNCPNKNKSYGIQLTKAPQNYCYIQSGELDK